MESTMKRSPINTFFIRNDNGGRTLHVDKKEIDIKPGDVVEIVMPEVVDPVIMIPVKGVFARQIYTCEKGSDTITMKVLDKPEHETLRFGYAIYCPEILDFAIGDSPPKMNLGGGGN